MKKFFYFLCALCAVMAIGQSYAQDSLQQIPELVNLGVGVLTATGNAIIPGVDNTISGSLITALILGVIRFIEKRKLKKKHNAAIAAAAENAK